MHVKAENLSKGFDDRNVIENISLEARAGFVLGILGPKHSGKTTILRILIDIIRADSGVVTYDDEVMSGQIRNAIGYLPQVRGLYSRYSINKILMYFARLKNMSRKKARIETVRLLDRFNMIEMMDVPVQELPEEALQKIHLMVTILHNPDFFIFDEPFQGFDAANRELMRKMLRRFRDEGKTIIIATEHMNEAESYCDEVLFLQHGRIVLQDSIARIRNRFQENLIVIEASDNLQYLKGIQGVKRFIQENHIAKIYVDNQVPLQKTMNTIINAVNVTRIEVNRPGLRDIFAEVTRENKKSAV